MLFRPKLSSGICNEAQLRSPQFQHWAHKLRESPEVIHRKVWEYCFITQALAERGMLRKGRRGLGFAVGQEPLSALFASMGCQILATDLAADHADVQLWSSTGQHAADLDALNQRGICPERQFRQRVRFRPVDMRDLPADLGRFDFLWSSCSLEHLGGIELGEEFIFNALRHLKPGGWAIHTTEYNLSSNTNTVSTGGVVLYRRQDIERIAARLRRRGCRVTPTFIADTGPLDWVIDREPYTHNPHLRLELFGYTVTSYGLIIQT